MIDLQITILVFIVIILIVAVSLLFSFVYVYKDKLPQFKFISRVFLNRKSDKNKIFENKVLKKTLLSTLLFLSKNHIGSLIVVEKEISLSLYEESGFKINSNVSSEFLISIFSNKDASFHDGAAIISKNHITAISCYLPISKTIIDLKYGARHRSAMGISEITDAVAFVVSETTGFVSCCINGKLLNLKKEKEKIQNCLERLL